MGYCGGNNQISDHSAGKMSLLDRGLTPATDLSYSQSNSLPLVLFVSCWLAGLERGGRCRSSAEESQRSGRVRQLRTENISAPLCKVTWPGLARRGEAGII